MAKRLPDFDSVVKNVEGFLREFQAETDRGTIVVASAYLDDLLAGMLRKHFVDQPKIVDRLLDFQGPLGTFSSRISLTYCLGLIREDQFSDLNTTRKIRNAAAHSHQKLSFDESPICDFCDDLRQLRLVEQARDELSPMQRHILLDQYKTRRQKFIGTAVHIAVGLMVGGNEIVHAQIGGTVESEGTKLPFE